MIDPLVVGKRTYDWMYRLWAPWDKVGVRQDLAAVLEQQHASPATHPRAIDLGCGTGANVVYLQQQGFDAHGVDFSEVAIGKARARAARAGVEPTFVVGDLTAPDITGIEGPFDFIIDFGTLDDLRGDARRAMAATVTRLSRPGSLFLEYCFFGITEELPRFSFSGTSKMSHIAPGELEGLFKENWAVEMFAHYEQWRTAVFLLTRR
jgi:SAM-dependent methyltransferase